MEDLILIKCPKCGKTTTIEGFDVSGADRDNVFCTDCHCEFDPDTGQKWENSPWHVK